MDQQQHNRRQQRGGKSRGYGSGAPHQRADNFGDGPRDTARTIYGLLRTLLLQLQSEIAIGGLAARISEMNELLTSSLQTERYSYKSDFNSQGTLPCVALLRLGRQIRAGLGPENLAAVANLPNASYVSLFLAEDQFRQFSTIRRDDGVKIIVERHFSVHGDDPFSLTFKIISNRPARQPMEVSLVGNDKRPPRNRGRGQWKKEEVEIEGSTSQQPPIEPLDFNSEAVQDADEQPQTSALGFDALGDDGGN